MDGRTELIDALGAHLAGSLVALDFDGTLSPLVDDPADSRLADGAFAAIARLADAGAHIAIVTGRDATTVLALSGLAEIPGLSVDGLYGADRWRAGELQTLPDHPALVRARNDLPALLAGEAAAAGAWVEDKRLSLVVHTRTASDPAAALNLLREPVLALAGRVGLELHPGHNVLELRLPGYDKGRVLRRLVDDVGAVAVLYAGDDMGDVPAFAVAADMRAGGMATWSVAVGDPPGPEVHEAADLSVAGPSDLIELLVEIGVAAETRGSD